VPAPVTHGQLCGGKLLIDVTWHLEEDLQ
jgi:hypothetical protein